MWQPIGYPAAPTHPPHAIGTRAPLGDQNTSIEASFDFSVRLGLRVQERGGLIITGKERKGRMLLRRINRAPALGKCKPVYSKTLSLSLSLWVSYRSRTLLLYILLVQARTAVRVALASRTQTEHGSLRLSGPCDLSFKLNDRL